MSSIQGRKRSSLTRRQFEEEDELPEPGQGYSPSRFAGFADYMRRKRIKLQDKDVELRLAPPRDKAQIFRGIIVYVNGYTVPSQHEIQRLITSNGGHVVAKLDRMTAVTHIITSVLTPKKREEFQRFKVVKPDWVTESVKAGRLLPWQHFKLLTPRSEQVVPSTAPVASVYSPKKTRSFTQQQERSRRKQSNASFFSCVEILTAPPPQKKAKLEKSKDDVVVSQSPVKDTFKASVEEVVGIPGDEIESGDDTPPPSHPSSISEPPASQPPPTQLPLTTHSPIVSQPPVSQSLPSVPSLPSLPGSIPPTSQPLPPSSPAQVVHSSAVKSSQTNPEEPPPAQRQPGASPRPLTSSGRAPLPPPVISPPDFYKSPTRKSPPPPRTRIRNTNDPNFIHQFYSESRLHHLSTWKAQLKARIQEATSAHSAGLKKPLQKRPPGQRRYILHVDFDSFFAAVAMKKNPHLKEKPVAVAHGTGPGAEIASCNYPARSYGIKNGMWMKYAQQLCPSLTVVPYDFPGYEEASKQFYDVILKINGIVQSVSIDEALIDISGEVLSSTNSTGVGISEGSIYREQARADEIAKQLRDGIRASTGCEVSVGIGGNILQAKVALRKAKPAGQFLLKPEQVLDFIGKLTVQDLPGVAHSMGAKLEEMGVKLVSDLRELSRERLMNTLGPKTGEKLYQYARGIDNTELGQEPPRKSISAEINWGIRFKNDQEAEDFVRNLCGELHRRCVEHGSRGSLFTMRLMRRAAGAPMEPAKHGGHGPCDTLNKSIKLGVPTNDPAILAREAVSILRGFAGDPRDIRGLGVQLTKLEPIKQIVGQYFRDSQRKLDFSRKPAHAPITPRKENRLRDALQDPDEIESPQKGEALPEGVPEANEALNDPTKKKLNITGNQFILPPEQDGKKEEPKLIPTVPGDILSQLRKQPRRESSGEANASAVEDDSELARKSMQRPPTKPPLRRDLDPSKKPVSLPPKSELDLSVLSELPEDIREEYLRQYSLPQHGSTRNTTVRQDPGGGQLKLGETMKHKSRKVHPAAWARYNKNITLTQTVFRPPSSQEEKFADTVHKPDPEVLQALPPHIQAEVIRESKIKEQEARLRYRRRLNYKPSPPPDRSPDHKFVVSPRRPAIPIFTSAGLTKVPEIRERLSEWFKGYKPDGPYQEDTDILCNYLKDVVLVERDMAKAVAVANWLAWLVKDGFAGDELGELEGHLARRDENANRHNGFLEGRDGERHDAGEMSDEELLRTSESWRQTVLQVKTAINDAVKQRGLGEVSFAL